MTSETLPRILANRAVSIGDRPVYHYMAPRATEPDTLTYRQLYHSSCALAAALRRYGFQGRNALLMYPPGLDFIKTFFGCMQGNVTAIPMYVPPGNTPDTRLFAIAATVDIAVTLTIKTKEAQVRSLVSAMFPGKECLVLCTDEMPQGDEVAVDWGVDIEQPPLIQFTSGSTSNPKGVVVTHTNLVNNQLMIERGFRRHAQTRGGETMVSWLPFFHDMGLICSIMHPVFIGGCTVLMSPNDFLQNPHKWLQLISAHSATIAGAPNFAYDYCVSRVKPEQIEGLDLNSWRVAYNGSEMIRPLTMKRFCDRFAEYGFHRRALFYCYGMAETTLYVSGSTGAVGDSDTADTVASVGVPDEESEVIIVADDKTVLADGETGEIWVRGPHVARGYINNPKATQETFEAKPGNDKAAPSYLRTGDLGYMRQGNLYMVGRAKNLLVVNGKNYFGEEIEYFVARSNRHFVESGACILQTNEGFANAEIVFMQEIHKTSIEAVRANLEELEAEALQLSLGIVNEFKLSVHRFIFLRAGRLPRTSSGKIDRARARGLAKDTGPNCLLDVGVR